VTVRDNADQRRYEALVDGEVAGLLFYRPREGELVLVHTQVEEGFAGQGIGSRLIAAALDDIRARGLRIVPICRFVRAYLERHPEHADLVAA
jgi:uncharacterized protein